MSAASDKFENDIAEAINSLRGLKASRPKVSTGYSDVLIEENNQKHWLEVKMNHTDNLSNPRVFYMDGKWQTTYKTPVAFDAVDRLNKSQKAKQFIKDIAKFSGIPEKVIIIGTSKGHLKLPGCVQLNTMKEYFSQPSVNRYILEDKNVDMGEVITKHYTEGKVEPAYYLQADDDFYMISRKNPMKLPSNVPVLKGTGDFKVRVSTRSQFYEVQAETKIKKLPHSAYSCKMGSSKKNPFIK